MRDKKVKTFIICADDFGQNEEITRGILELIELERISATSCMTNLEEWPEFAKTLQKQTHIDRGVHLNFTHGSPLSTELKKKLPYWPNSPVKLLAAIFKGELNSQLILDEIILQLNAFEQALGQQPDFIDGHQHLHHFPVIAKSFLAVYQARYQTPHQKPYVRVSLTRPQIFKDKWWLKKKIIDFSGSHRLRKRLIQHNIPFNPFFGGVYDLSPLNTYKQIIESAFPKLKDGTLWMCHPGHPSQCTLDPIKQTRPIELNYLKSLQFADFCKQHNIRIGRYQALTTFNTEK
jgi:predicted glycoside hydrolase/deacetylase ChbG (UPF0249 family)